MSLVNSQMPDEKSALPKILIVDDKVENLVALEAVLAPLAVNLIRATSGNEAISLTLDHDFALALLDVQMPDMDGFETVELLRENSKTENLPIIFLSAIYSGDFYKVKGVDVGGVDFIEKPVVPEILIGKVRLFLELYASRNKLLAESFQNVVENVSDGVMIVDRNGLILLANPAASVMLGGAKGRSRFDYPLTPGELREIVIENADGRLLQVELNVSKMLWQGDAVYVVSLRDITERLKTKKALEETIEDLDSKNRELQSFTYTVSHDLKSPLITIGGYIGLLEQALGKSMPDDVRFCVGEIHAAAEKMGNLLDHLLILSRIGRTENPFTEVSLNDVAAEVVRELSVRFKEKKIELRVASDLPHVMGDHVRLHQVLQNLLENAIKYMNGQAQPLVEVGVAETEAGKALFVRDNGPGILPKFHEKVFGLFERLHADDNGTGVGLSLVKKIVELHKGNIWIESEGDGSGTIFWIKLPFV